MGSLRMPDNLRHELSSKDFGNLLSGNPAENARSVIAAAKSRQAPKVVVVGDFTLKAFLNSGFRPDLGIFDRKTRRSDFLISEKVDAEVLNPAGQISDEAVAAIRRLLSLNRPSLLLVNGEEDLLSLPSVLYSPDGSIVVYGMPGEGMMVITTDAENKEKVKKLLEKFERLE